jgi:transposase
LELRPIHGRTWQPKSHPTRLRATYRRLEGTEQLLAFYDVHAKCLAGEVHKRKTTADLLEVFKKLRACYPASVRLYLVMDNLSSHRTLLLAGFMAANNMEAVFTPTYSSWLNAIESHFAHVRKFTCQLTDDRDHMARRRRIHDYLLWWNKEAHSDHSCLASFMSIHLEGH